MPRVDPCPRVPYTFTWDLFGRPFTAGGFPKVPQTQPVSDGTLGICLSRCMDGQAQSA
jgi:hypothetical protein